MGFIFGIGKLANAEVIELVTSANTTAVEDIQLTQDGLSFTARSLTTAPLTSLRLDTNGRWLSNLSPMDLSEMVGLSAETPKMEVSTKIAFTPQSEGLQLKCSSVSPTSLFNISVSNSIEDCQFCNEEDTFVFDAQAEFSSIAKELLKKNCNKTCIEISPCMLDKYYLLKSVTILLADGDIYEAMTLYNYYLDVCCNPK